MCGISGLINLKGSEFQGAEAILKMTSEMRHRGPDDEGYLTYSKTETKLFGGQDTPHEYQLPQIGSNLGETASIFLGHRRLSIIDLSQNGHQPMMDNEESAQSLFVFNGEIYNYKELEPGLEKEQNWNYNSDTRVLFSLFKQKGLSCLEELRGMFAFAFIDLERKKAFLVRDRLGIKPLFYSIAGDVLIFGSEIRTILASGLITPEVSREGLWDNFSYRVSPRPQTAFKNIQAVKPGHFLEIDLENGNIKQEQYWDLPTGVRTRQSKEEVLEKTESLIAESIKYRLISDVEVSSFLSAGIDSTLITAMAADQSQNLKGLTLALDPNSQEDESYLAGLNAKKFGLEHLISVFDSKTGFSELNDYVRCFEEPAFALPPVYFLSKVAHEKGMKVILNGLGGDEFFGGYPVFKYIKYHPFRKLLRPLLKLKKRDYSYNENILYNMVFSNTNGTFYGANYSFFSEEEKKRLFKGPIQENSLNIWDERFDLEGMSLFDAMVYLSSKHFLANHTLYRGDAFSMFHSLEMRFPLLDHKLIEYAMTIPQDLLLKTTERKYILREILKPKADPRTFTMKKKGFSVPAKFWMNPEMQKLIENKLEQLKTREIFNSEEVDKVYQNFIKKDARKVWHLVMTELWLEEFMD